jgi:hypothetical protein
MLDADSLPAPLVLSGSTGAPMLAIFTSLDRATPMSTAFSDYRFALLVEFRWLLQRVADGVGLVVNPGWHVGLEMPPSGVAQMKAEKLST